MANRYQRPSFRTSFLYPSAKNEVQTKPKAWTYVWYDLSGTVRLPRSVAYTPHNRSQNRCILNLRTWRSLPGYEIPARGTFLVPGMHAAVPIMHTASQQTGFLELRFV